MTDTYCVFALKGNGQIFFRELLSHQGINEILMTKRITLMSWGVCETS